MVGCKKLGVQPLKCVSGGFQHHVLQIITNNLIAATLKHPGAGEGFF